MADRNNGNQEVRNQQSQSARGRSIVQNEMQQGSPGKQQQDQATDVKKSTK